MDNATTIRRLELILEEGEKKMRQKDRMINSLSTELRQANTTIAALTKDKLWYEQQLHDLKEKLREDGLGHYCKASFLV